MNEAKLFNRFPELISPDLILRQITTKNLEDLYEICSNDNLYIYRPSQAKKNYALVYNLITQYQRDYAKQKSMVIGIYLRSATNKLVGFVEVYNFDKIINMVNIGYVLNDKYWGQGIATKAVHMTISYLFRVGGLNRIQAFVVSENIRSRHVLLRNHFTHEGTLRQGIHWPEKGVIDIELFAILHCDYVEECYL